MFALRIFVCASQYKIAANTNKLKFSSRFMYAAFITITCKLSSKANSKNVVQLPKTIRGRTFTLKGSRVLLSATQRFVTSASSSARAR